MGPGRESRKLGKFWMIEMGVVIIEAPLIWMGQAFHVCGFKHTKVAVFQKLVHVEQVSEEVKMTWFECI